MAHDAMIDLTDEQTRRLQRLHREAQQAESRKQMYLQGLLDGAQADLGSVEIDFEAGVIRDGAQ